jgi:subtilisin family serine protease
MLGKSKRGQVSEAVLLGGLLALGAAACNPNRDLAGPRSHRSFQAAALGIAQPYYYYQGQQTYLTMDPTRLVATSSLPTAAGVALAAKALVAPLGTQLLDSADRLGPPPYHWLLRLPANSSPTIAAAARTRLAQDARFKFVSHVFKTIDGNNDVIPLDHVVVLFKPGVTAAVVENLATSLGSRVVRPPVPDSGYKTYLLSAPSDSSSDVLGLANRLQANGIVEWASPDFVSDWHVHYVPPDPFFSLQYYFKNTVTYGGVAADDNIEPAWDLTRGSASIRITYVDAGIDSHHSEFSNRSMTGFDAVWYDSPPGSGEWAGQPDNQSSHGTSVAGIATALHDGIGTAGVAPNVQLDAVRIFRRVESINPPPQVATAVDIANGITWAYQTIHSDVLNNSWGGGAQSQVIRDAVTNALALGRGGKGTVVVFSAGNTLPPPPLTQTWQSQIPGVIAVAALARDGSHASYSDTGALLTVSAFGGEYNPLTCYGADIVTTDLSFSHACNDGPSGTTRYTGTFSGTSAAAPQVSGVAALLLSREPGLTAAQVKARIVVAADPWGNTRLFGFGKLNAYFTLVSATANISGPTSVTPPCINFPCQGQPYTWTAVTTGGNGTITYQWLWEPCGQVAPSALGTAQSQTLSLLPTSPDFYLQVKATSAGRTTTTTIFVDNTNYIPPPFVTCLHP